jgi:Tfp pilus assembly protein PilF
VNTENGRPLWADKFDQMFQDVFTLQDTISDQVIDALTLKLSADEQSLFRKRQPRNSEAFRLYLKGRYMWSKWSEEGFKKSIRFFDRAIEADPNYAQAYAGCADAYTSLCFYGHMSPQEAMPQVKTMAQTALRLDENLAEARLPLASALFMYDWDWAGAENEYKQCIQQNPNYANAHHGYGLYLIALKRFEEATLQLNRALEADPVSPLIKATAGFPYHYSGDIERALRQYRETLEEEPHFGLAHVALAEIYILKGMHEEALHHYQQAALNWGEKFILPYLGYAYAVAGKRREASAILKKLQALSQQEYISPLSIATVYLGLGEIDDTFAWLEKAYQGRCNKLVFLGVQPTFSLLRADPRFTDLLRRIGLEAWPPSVAPRPHPL